MKFLCLDLSLHCGFAVLEAEPISVPAIGHPQFTTPKLLDYGTLHYEGLSVKERDNYPWSYLGVVNEHIHQIMETVVLKVKPDIIVIEETNKGKNRYSQKMLEFLHCELLKQIGFLSFRSDMGPIGFKKLPPDVIYLDTSAWRSTLGIWMSKDQKKQNAKLSKAKKEGPEALKKMKKSLGVRGRVNKKHLALAHVNTTFNLTLKVKDNDASDAICLGLAYLNGTKPSNGV